MARAFNGSQRIDVTGKFSSPATVTIAGWARSTETDNKQIMLAIGGDGLNLGFRFGSVYGFHYDGSYREFSFVGSCADNTWYHLAFVCNPGGATQKVYLDGAEIFSDTQSTAISYPSANSTIGGNGVFDLLSGNIAELAVWGAALTADEVVSLAKAFSPALIRPASLLMYAPLVRDIVDIKGNTLANVSSTVSDHIRVLNRRRRDVSHKAVAAGGSSNAPRSAYYHLAGGLR